MTTDFPSAVQACSQQQPPTAATGRANAASSFTPGPYRVSHSGLHVQAQFTRIASDGKPITYWADIAHTPSTCATVMATDARRANARLFAAAHDLLKAGEALYHAIGDLEPNESPFRNDRVMAAGKAWCTAVAKAEGRQS